MKKLILSVSIAAIFAACGNPNTSGDTSAAKENAVADTTGLSEYKQWKEQQNVVSVEGNNTLDNSNILPEEDRVTNAPIVRDEQPAKTVSVSRAPKAAKSSRNKAVVKAPQKTYGNSESGTTNSSSRDDQPVTTQPTVSSGPIVSNEPVVTTVPEVPETKEKKGWSKAAKGTAIGAGSGAVLGAIISKKKGTGAVIGGIVGAAGGYVLGRSQDKKDGRY